MRVGSWNIKKAEEQQVKRSWIDRMPYTFRRNPALMAALWL